MPFQKNVCQPFGLIAALLAISGLLLLGGCEKGPGKQVGAPPAPEVAVYTVAPRQITLTTELPGRTSPYLVSEIRPQVSGLIQKRLFQEGSDVQSGQLLYQIDPVPFQVALDTAEAALSRAQASYSAISLKAKRYRNLLSVNAVSQQSYDDAAAALQQVMADIEYYKTSVKTARINLEYTHVLAPISGRIGRSNVTDGALVSAYQPAALATIQQLDPIYVDVHQSSSELLRLRTSLKAGLLATGAENRKKVLIVLENGSSYAQEGTLLFRDVTVDPATGSFAVRIVVPNQDHLLLPGMFVRAVIEEGVVEKAIMVPQQGVSRNPKGEPVALVVDESDTVQQHILTLDRAIGNQWLVSSGLAPGDRLIVEGMQKVRPGTVVKAVPWNNPETEAKAPTAAPQSSSGN